MAIDVESRDNTDHLKGLVRALKTFRCEADAFQVRQKHIGSAPYDPNQKSIRSFLGGKAEREKDKKATSKPY